MNNHFQHNNVKYFVTVKQGFAAQQMAEIFKSEDKTKPLVGGTFAKNVSFEDVIMDWAKKCVAKILPQTNIQ